jgi:pimeloyl-ACP methyl ester carboxylesterase
MSPIKSIAFAHGIWADGSCFSKLMPPLRADGYEVIASQHALDDFQADVDCCVRTFARVPSPILLVGHSYGGAVITAAGNDDRVAGLVYISALGPDEDETLQGEQDKFPKTNVFKSIEVADGRVWMLPEGIEYFAGDLTEEEKQVVYATANPPAASLFSGKISPVAWRKKPSWSIVAQNDQSVHPDLERTAAKRMNAKVTEVASSHVPMLSHPDVVLKVIRDAANSL